MNCSLTAGSLSLIDTHCHLDMSEFDDDRKDVIKRARAAGIEAIVTVGSNLKGSEDAVELASRHDFIYASVGIHPHDAKNFTDGIYKQLKKWASEYRISGSRGQGVKGSSDKLIHSLGPSDPRTLESSFPKVVAIGETGLDYHYGHSPRDIQKEVFRKHLALANELSLPAIIHSREAESDTMEILKESGIKRGVLHCFSGGMGMAETAIEMGLYISIAGPVTFKNAKKLGEIAGEIPDDYLLIETDAPYLTPEPLRGKRNEPAFILNTAKRIAELRGITLEDVSRITTLNAKRLFGFGGSDIQGVVAYRIRDSLYLNITNRCTNRCSFCVRFYSDFVKGHNLRLSNEPTEDELKTAIVDPSRYNEVVFCGYGEPLLRLDLVKAVSGWIKEKGGRVRVNTNGHGNLIHKRNILPELSGLVDSISVSLDAHDEATYNRICAPAYSNAFNEIILFIKEAKKYIPDVQATVVEMEGVDIQKCRELTDELDIKLRVRKLDVVG